MKIDFSNINIKFLKQAVTQSRSGDTSIQDYCQNILERTPEKDTVEFSNQKPESVENASETQSTKKFTGVSRTSKVSGVPKFDPAKLQKKLNIIQEEKMLTPEILHFLMPKEENNFTLSQARVINAVFDKLVFFKEISMELADEANKYGPEIKEYIKGIFGGEDGFGKDEIVYCRTKDDVSVFNKLVKEFKNEYIKNNINNTFLKKLGVDKPYALLTDEEKETFSNLIKEGAMKLETKDFKQIENVFRASSRVQERKEAIDWVKDLVGVRLVLPTGSQSELSKVEKYIDKAINNDAIKITRFSNYHGSHILPYIKKDKARMWAQQVSGMKLVENSQVRKKNGYTTTQMNIEYMPKDGRKRPVFVEFQLRTKELNEIGNREHLIYDILEDKDITKGIPELKTFFDSIGIVKAVKSLFGDSELEEKYSDYERAYYSYLRNNENEKKYHVADKPLLFQFGLGEYEYPLSFDALEGIEAKAEALKKEYGKKDTKTNKQKLEYLHKLQ